MTLSPLTLRSTHGDMSTAAAGWGRPASRRAGRVAWQNSYRDAFAGIEEGTVDLAFRGVRAPAGLRSEPLFVDRYVCVVAETHRLAHAQQLSLSEFLTAHHVDIAILDNAETGIDRRLAAQNARPEVRASVPSAAFALELVKRGDLLTTMPLHLPHGSASRAGRGRSARPRRSEASLTR